MWVPGQEASKPVASPRPVSAPAAPPSATQLASVSSSRFSDNLIAAFAYAVIPAIIFVLIQPMKRNRFVRFHSFQSILLAASTIVIALGMRIVYSVLTMIPVAGYLLAFLVVAIALLAWITIWLVALVKALQGEAFHLPVIGSLAERA
jgi:uncharacterized membrane protein